MTVREERIEVLTCAQEDITTALEHLQRALTWDADDHAKVSPEEAQKALSLILATASELQGLGYSGLR